MKKFKNQKVVLVGGSSGMGLATAKILSNAGASVVIAGRNLDKLTSAKQEIGGEVTLLQFDMNDEEAIKKGFQSIGTFKHLFVTGSSPSFVPIDSAIISNAQDEFNSKFWGQYKVVKNAIPFLETGSSIVLTSGAYGLRPDSGTSIMSAANGAIESLVRALAVELSPIRVNAVSPGLVDTPLMRNSFSEEVRANIYQSVEESLLTKRVATAEDVALAVEFLFSSLHITGSAIRVDGGATLF